MKREIKFRAWDTENEIWLNYIKLSCSGEMMTAGDNEMIPIQNPERVVIMQFTGLLDRLGKEVFEGDLVSWSNKTYTIKWYEKIASFVMEEGENKLERPSMKLQSQVIGIELQSKVIGNIYESKHLLDNTDTKEDEMSKTIQIYESTFIKMFGESPEDVLGPDWENEIVGLQILKELSYPIVEEGQKE